MVTLYKQWISVIDSRTTTVCLNAAGQIQPIDEPFETLNGLFDMPPAHDSCRSDVAPYLEGMVNVQRQDANRELQNRPKEQRDPRNGTRLPPPSRSNPPGRRGHPGDRSVTPLPAPSTRVTLPPVPKSLGDMAKILGKGDRSPEVRSFVENLAKHMGDIRLPGIYKVAGIKVRGFDGGSLLTMTIRHGGRDVGTVLREIHRLEDGRLAVTNRLFDLDAQHTARGLGTVIDEALVRIYVVAGVDVILVRANIDVGGYAWARRGYDWDFDRMSRDDVLKVLGHVRNKSSGRALRDVNRMMRTVKSADPEDWPTPWEVSRIGWKRGASTWPGKAGLMDSAWDGVRRLK